MIRSALKLLLIKYLNKKHLTIVPFDTNDGKIEKVKYDWLIDQNINTVIDVGASDGAFAMKARKLFPDAIIYSFEPILNSYKKLNKKFKSVENFKSFNIALSNTSGKSEFYQNYYVGASSFLEMSTILGEARPNTKRYTKITVDVDKLDNIIKTEELTPNIFLKIDVQGYEKHVLEGAKELLNNVKIIYTEVSFCQLYKEQPLFNDISDLLRERGFNIAGMENISQSLKDWAFLQANAFFIRDS